MTGKAASPILPDVEAREAYTDHAKACFDCLASRVPLSRKAGQFLGGEMFADYPLSPKQRDWLGKLLVKCGLPPLAESEGVE